jgi:hypothetical protein
MMPPDVNGTTASLNFVPPTSFGFAASSLIEIAGLGFLLKRPVLLKVPVVGVAGRTLIEVCGDRPTDLLPGECIVSTLLLDLLDALLWEACRGKDLILETDELVDFLPRRPIPPEDRR